MRDQLRGHEAQAQRWHRGKAVVVLGLLTALFGCSSCGYMGALVSALLLSARGGSGGGSGASSTVDRSQPLVPAISNLQGGVFAPFVNLWNGNLLLMYPILNVPDAGPDWDLRLFYNSTLQGETTTLGPGWRHSYEIALLLGVPDPSSITVRWGDGRRDPFVSDGSGWAAAPALHGMRITQTTGGYRLRTKHGFVYEFETTGRLVALRDRNGNAMTLAYVSGRLATVTDASGRSCQFNYDTQGRLVSLVGLQHPSLATFDYEGALLVRVRDAAGNPCAFSYNPGSLLWKVTDADADGMTVQYHPGLPVVLRVETTDGASRRITYDHSLLETSVFDAIAPGQESVTRYRFDTAGRCVSVIDGPLGTTQNAYDGASNLLAHTDADGHVTTMTYSTMGDLLTVTDPTSATRTYTHDASYHLVLTVTDETNNTWSGQRDSNGNLTRWTDPLGNHDDYAYGPRGLLTSHTDRRNNTATFGYNANGDLTLMTDAAGKSLSATYNSRGMPVSITDEENGTFTATLTGRDEIASVALPGGELYTLSWTASRLRASVTDPRNATISWQYNDRKQLVAQTDALGFTANLIRNGDGFVIRAVNALGNTTHYDRDLAGRVTAIRDPDGGVVSFLSGSCDILSRTDALGTVNFGYTARHELSSRTGTDVQSSYGWDPRGLLSSASQTNSPNPTLGYNFGYDAAGRTISIEATHLGPRTATLVLDPEGNPTQVTTNLSPTPLTYTYDNLNLPASVTAGSPPLTANLSYTPRRQIAQISYSSGVGANYGYDADGRLTGIQYQGANFSATYSTGYDASGNPTSIAVNLPAPIGSGSIQVDYDLRGLPISVNVGPGGITTITYNQVRDRSQLVGPNGTVAYSYTWAQRMIGAGPTALQWNMAGGCANVSNPSLTTAFSYRTDGVLQSVTQNSQKWQVLVGPLGEIARVVLPGGSSRWFAYDFADRGGLLRRVIMNAPGSQVTDTFVFAAGLEARAEASSPVGASAAPLMWLKSPPSQGNQRAPLTDPWGSVTVVADGSGNMLQARVYGVFGELLAGTSNPQFLAQGFLGMDVEEGLVDLHLQGMLSSSDDIGYLFGQVRDRSEEVREHGRDEAEAVRPYLAGTGCFLYDVDFGPDGLYGSGSDLNQFARQLLKKLDRVREARSEVLQAVGGDKPPRAYAGSNDPAAAARAEADPVVKVHRYLVLQTKVQNVSRDYQSRSNLLKADSDAR